MAPRLIQLRPGSISGADLILADSLRKATMDPVNVTAPMKTPTMTSTEWMPGYAVRSYDEFQPTSTAARPTKLWSIAMSSGMPVISTLRARSSPMAAPMPIAARMSASPTHPDPSMPTVTRPTSATETPPVAARIVATRAMAMPIMPKRLPARAVSCRDSPARARMNARPATM